MSYRTFRAAYSIDLEDWTTFGRDLDLLLIGLWAEAGLWLGC